MPPLRYPIPPPPTRRRHTQALAHLLAPLHSERSSAATRPPLEGVTIVPEIAAAPSSRLCVWGGWEWGGGWGARGRRYHCCCCCCCCCYCYFYHHYQYLPGASSPPGSRGSRQARALPPGTRPCGRRCTHMAGAWWVHGRCMVDAWTCAVSPQGATLPTRHVGTCSLDSPGRRYRASPRRSRCATPPE